MRTVVRTLIAGVLVIMGTGVAGPALAAQGALATQAQGGYQASRTGTAATSSQGSSSSPDVSIVSIGPNRYASPNSVITVKGTITNHTRARVDGVQVRLETSASSGFSARSNMAAFASGSAGDGLDSALVPVGQPWMAPEALRSGATLSWSITVAEDEVGYSRFGVYPLEARAFSADGAPLGEARTLLPYWAGPDSGSPAPQKLDIAWVWPLVDTPQQGACPQHVATNELAASLAPSGRLGGLAAAGLRYAGSAQLTWAVDPALLSDASVMTGRYKVGGNAGCTDTIAMPASAAASQWLTSLRAQTATDPMFVTPYADADVSALTHAGQDQAIAESYAIGDSEAQAILNRPQPFGPGSPVAYPDGGVADASVLTSLAQEGKVTTTVLASDQMPTQSFEDDAVTRVPTGVGTEMTVLLADSQLTGLLGSATASSPQGTQFAAAQEILAQTAMIVAQAPSASRSVVLAPPTRWDPSEPQAAALLAMSSAPWLHPVPLSSLTTPAAAVQHKPLASNMPAPQELGPGYLRAATSGRQLASVYLSMLSRPSAQTMSLLSAAVAVPESTAWRGRGSKGGWAALDQLQGYVKGNEQQVQIVSTTKVVLAGTSGATPVSIANFLPEAVQVKVSATVPPGSQISVSDLDGTVDVPAFTTKTVRLQVHSAALGSVQLRLQLLTRNGAPLSSPTQPLSVETTRFGRTLLILIAAALGVLVLTSVARWTRRWLRDGGNGHHVSGRSGGADDAGEGSAASDSVRAGQAAGENVTSDDGTTDRASASGGSGGTG
ncbi:MAG TPA: DUF6049 family protein [Trebonia sp.]|nr:DUF6049 family protein [Trebonia sp.]